MTHRVRNLLHVYKKENLVEYQMRLSFDINLTGTIRDTHTSKPEKHTIKIKRALCKFWSYQDVDYKVKSIPMFRNIDPEFNVSPNGKLIDDVDRTRFIAGYKMFNEYFYKNDNTRMVFLERILNEFLLPQDIDLDKGDTLEVSHKIHRCDNYGYFFSRDFCKYYTFNISEPKISGKIIRTNKNQSMDRIIF